MKKVVFSAVALVAFSFAGMANNEVKEKKSEDRETKKVVLKENNVCCTLHSMAFDLAIFEGADSATAGAYADLVYNNCLKSQ
ncbi:hypothetical protein [Flavobacterium sp.]|uniref:hypothetical protein n=1 Tax=Flavobacterium sp. TaxID=239 RepID=UPI0035297047